MALSYRHDDYSLSWYSSSMFPRPCFFLLFHWLSFLCASWRQELQVVIVTHLWSILIANFSVLSETTRRSSHERAIISFLDSRCVFSFSWSARCRIRFIGARLRSICPDNAHVKAIAQLHLQLGLSMLIGSVRRYGRRRWRRRWWTVVPLTISLASGRPVFFAFPRVMMIMMSGVSVDRQSGIRGLATICLMPGGQRRRWRRLMTTNSRDSILESGFQSSHPIVRFSGRELWLRMRRSTQGVTGVMGSRSAGRDPVDRCGAQWRRAIIHDAPTASSRSVTSSFSSSSSSAVTGSIVRDGQRSRAAHLARRLAVDVGKALGEGGAAVWQKPDPAGPGARRPKF